jgi:hypothetical protein
MVPVCSSSSPAFSFNCMAFLVAMERILPFVVVVPRGLTTAETTFPFLSTRISTATFAFSLNSSSKEGRRVNLLPFSPLLILTPLLPPDPLPL